MAENQGVAAVQGGVQTLPDRLDDGALDALGDVARAGRALGAGIALDGTLILELVEGYTPPGRRSKPGAPSVHDVLDMAEKHEAGLRAALAAAEDRVRVLEERRREDQRAAKDLLDAADRKLAAADRKLAAQAPSADQSVWPGSFKAGRYAGRGKTGGAGALAYLEGVAERLAALAYPLNDRRRHYLIDARAMLDDARTVLATDRIGDSPVSSREGSANGAIRWRGSWSWVAAQARMARDCLATAPRGSARDAVASGLMGAIEAHAEQAFALPHEPDQAGMAERVERHEGALAALRVFAAEALARECFNLAPTNEEKLARRALHRVCEHVSFALYGAERATTRETWDEEGRKLAARWIDGVGQEAEKALGGGA